MDQLRQWMNRLRQLKLWQKAALAVAFVGILFSVALGVWLVKLDRNIAKRFAEKRFASPVEFYSAPETVRAGSKFPRGYFDTLFARKNFRKRDFGQPIQPGDYSFWSAQDCVSVVPRRAADAVAPEPSADLTDPSQVITEVAPVGIARCIAFRNRNAPTLIAGAPTEDAVHIIAIAGDQSVYAVYSGAEVKEVASVDVEADLFAQYYGDKPILRNVVPLGQVPILCLKSLLAIEDSEFLEHPGISVTGLVRAVITNLRAGRHAQGGSTITQQLVKNYFLTDEKTLKRKITEIAMAFLVERHATKDEILETYINLIYMGQNGPFEVRGFAAASEHYFAKPIGDLKLEECALLAAILNSPGLYNPFQHPERATKRRLRVLDRMQELQMINSEENKLAANAPLPAPTKRLLTEPAPYFVQAVRRALSDQSIDTAEGLKVFTTLNLRAQEAAQQAVRAGLTRIESTYTVPKKVKAQGKNLEAVLISADPATGAVQALVGGRGYLVSQFNRAVDSHRQVGSVMKPFVYLTAFENRKPDGAPYTPLTMISDTETTHRFQGQRWTPRNYEGTYQGDVPVFYALKESINAATVNLGMSVGIDNVIDVSHRLGISSKMQSLPSVTLGAFELTPMEVLQAYSSLARLGEKRPLTLLHRVEDLNGAELYVYKDAPEQVVASETTSELVGVMKQTLLSGTGRGVTLSGFTAPAAGKTGTTNDKKDAWFAGFTPYHTAIVWVGYDDNTPHGLTGGSGAVPIWSQYMNSYGVSFPNRDFPWPADSTEKVLLSPEQQLSFGVPQKKDPLQPIELIFKRDEAPSSF